MRTKFLFLLIFTVSCSLPTGPKNVILMQPYMVDIWFQNHCGRAGTAMEHTWHDLQEEQEFIKCATKEGCFLSTCFS